MNNYITIDGGTTNTRLRLVKNNAVAAEQRLSMGAKDCINAKESYKNFIIDKIKMLLEESKIAESEIRAILASGMLTSETGLYTVPHITAPIGLQELNSGLVRADIGISSAPCYFVPGVRIMSKDPCESDIMRGEEAEFFGISEYISQNSVLIMPGSHTKHIFCDTQKRISTFKTFMTGEMLAAISQGTILLDSIDINRLDFDGDLLILGYDHSLKLGINRALFQTRILDKLFKKSPQELYSYFLGVILCGEINTLANSKKDIYICGRHILRKSMHYLIQHRLSLSATEICEQDSELAATRGAIRIFEYNER